MHKIYPQKCDPQSTEFRIHTGSSRLIPATPPPPDNLKSPRKSNQIQLGSDVVKVTIDNHLSMKEHVQRICQSSIHQLCQIRSVRSSLSRAACESLVHAFVSSRLDYCNSMLFGINEPLLDKLESVLRTAARLILQKRKFDSISTDIRDKLHSSKNRVQNLCPCLQMPTRYSARLSRRDVDSDC